MGRRRASSTRDTVVSVRLDEVALRAVDLLVSAGLAQSRSEAAALLIEQGIRGADDLLLQAKEIASRVQKLKQEMVDAVKANNVAKVESLLSRDSELVNAVSDHGETAVMMSAYYHANAVRDVLLQRAPSLDLFEACAVGKLSRVKDLLSESADLLNSHNNDGYTPLGLAAFFGHQAIVEFLLERGADVQAVSDDGRFNNTPLHASVAGGHLSVVLTLLNRNADINALATGRERAGYTALHVAARRGDYPIVSVLIAHGADPTVKTDEGLIPADLADQYGHKRVSQILRESGEPRDVGVNFTE